MDKKVQVENIIEQALQNSSIQNNELSLADVILHNSDTKAKIVEKFIADELQKTEITQSERKILPLMEYMANNPFLSCINKGKTEQQQEKIRKEFEVDFLQEFIDRYVHLGIPLNRKGRKEEVEALRSFLTSNEIEVRNNGGVFK